MRKFPLWERRVAGSNPVIPTTTNSPYLHGLRQVLHLESSTVATPVAKAPFSSRWLHLHGLLLTALILGAAPAYANPSEFPNSSFAVRPSPIAAPAGAHPVGRIDTEISSPGRAVMVSAWYPATETGTPAPLVPATDPATQLRIAARAADWMHAPATAAEMVGAEAAASENAAPAGDRLPVALFSPGMGTPRWIWSGLAGELASHGYVVVVADHTGETPAVEFPDGRIVFGDTPTVTANYMGQQLATRIADMRLILDHLTDLPKIGPRLDLSRIAALGHSYGGTTALQLAATDPRIRAVASLDGPAGWADVAPAPALDRPALLLDLTGAWTASWGDVGPQFEHTTILGAGHYSATDMCQFKAGPELCGTINADDAAQESRSVIGSFLARSLN